MIARDLVRLDDFAPVVVAAVPADRVRSLGLMALRAFDELRALYRQVGATFTLAGMRISGLGKSHEQPIIRSERGSHAAEAASWRATESATGGRKARLAKPRARCSTRCHERYPRTIEARDASMKRIHQVGAIRK